MDFTTGFTTDSMEAVTNKLHRPFDITFFLRPFTTASWAYIIVFTMATITIANLPLWKKADSISHRIVMISSWMFFLLINAYYGGALTMFFSSAPGRPFETVREGLLKYPEWKLTVAKADKSHIEYLANEVYDPPYVDFYERSLKKGQVYLINLTMKICSICLNLSFQTSD